MDVDRIICGDCLEELPAIPEDSIDAVITDPPYFLLDSNGKGFMGKEWESLNRKKSIAIVCKSKEFARFVESITLLLKVESSMAEANSVLQNASMPGQPITELNSNAPCVEKSSKENRPMSKANTNSVHGIALTKDALSDLLRELSQNPISAIERQPENVLFAVPILFIERLVKKHAPKSVSISMPKQADGSKDQEILLTSMEDQRIKNVIAVMSGKTCESAFMPETCIDARSATSIADTMKYRLITSEDIKNPLIMEWLIWLLYVIDAMSRSSTTGKTLTDFLNSDLVYQFHKQWAEETIRVLKPGGHMLVCGGTRTGHRMATAIEDVGFVCRDCISWVYGAGFPKSLNISVALDKMAGAKREVIGSRKADDIRGGNLMHRSCGVNENSHIIDITAPATDLAKQWAGFGTALKPAHEDWWLFRKPLSESTIAGNVLKWGCGGLNIDACRVEMNGETWDKNIGSPILGKNITGNSLCLSQDECFREIEKYSNPKGRFPANLIHDGSEPVLAEFAKAGERKSGARDNRNNLPYEGPTGWKGTNKGKEYDSSAGSAARFFKSCQFTEEDIPAFAYYAKASRSEREKGLDGMPLRNNMRVNAPRECESDKVAEKTRNFHPTVKPLALMRYLCRLICPPGGLVLDPFAGSGTTCLAAKLEGFGYIGIEKEVEYCDIARRRIAAIPARLDRWSTP